MLPKEGQWMAAATVGFDAEKGKPVRKYFYGKIRAEVGWENYETQVRKHIKPALGHIRLNQLQTAHLQKLYNEKLAGGRG